MSTVQKRDGETDINKKYQFFCPALSIARSPSPATLATVTAKVRIIFAPSNFFGSDV